MNGNAPARKWSRSSIQFTDEEYDRLLKERYESRKSIAQILRDGMALYFEQKDQKKKPCTTKKGGS